MAKGSPPIKDYAWQILDIRGFEQLCALAREEDFISLVAKKFTSPELQVQDMKTYIDNYVAGKEDIDRKVISHPILAAELGIFSKKLNSRYKLDRKSG